MRPDWDYFWSMGFALLLLMGVVNWAPNFQVFGYFCGGAMILRANVSTIVRAIERSRRGEPAR